MAWLLDTNVLSELKRPSPSYRVAAFVTESPLDELYVSTVTLAEIRFGIGLVADSVRRTELEQWLQDRVRPMFPGHVLEITEDILFRWRNLAEDGRKAGRTFSEPDLMLAATALEHDLILVTRNVKDFAGLGITLLNPWQMP